MARPMSGLLTMDVPCHPSVHPGPLASIMGTAGTIQGLSAGTWIGFRFCLCPAFSGGLTVLDNSDLILFATTNTR